MNESKPDDKLYQFCERCFATMDDGIAHCFNCGAGGAGVMMLKRQMDSIRESASWVGKRFYANEEDRDIASELRALRRAIGTYPGRSAKIMPADGDQYPAYWSIKQDRIGGGYIMVSLKLGEAATAEEAIAKTTDLLPWGGPR